MTHLDADCLIAATFLRVAAPIATTNIPDFQQFTPMGLRIISAV